MSDTQIRTERFTFLCSLPERELLRELAKHLNRSQGDSVRLLIRLAAQEMQLDKKVGGDSHQSLHDNAQPNDSTALSLSYQVTQ